MTRILGAGPIIAWGLLGLGLLLSACSAQPATKPTLAPPPPPAARVSAETVRRGDIQQTLSYGGDIHAPEQISVLPRASGRVDQILVDVGSRVDAGDTLAILDQDGAYIAVFQAQSQLAGAQAKLAVLLIGPRAEDVIAAQAAVDQQRTRLANMRSGGRAEDVRAAEDGLSVAQARLVALQNGADNGIRQAQQSAVDSDKAAVASAEAAFAALGGQNAANLEGAQAQVDALQAQVTSIQALIASTDAALENLRGASAADVQTAQSAYDQANAQLQVAQAALKQNYNPPQVAIAQAAAALEAARSQRNAAEAQQTALEQNAASPCADLPGAPRNATACNSAKAAASGAVSAADAAVEAAQGQLDVLKRGGTPAQQTQLKAAVEQASAQVTAAGARLDALQNGGVAAARAQADAQKQQALAQLVQVQANLDVANANLTAARNGALDAQVKNAQAQVTAARERLKADQARLDVTLQGPTDEDVQQAEAVVDQAQQQLQKARQPYTAYDLQQQQQAVTQAGAMLQKAQNPYTDQDVAAAQAAVEQAQAQLDMAQLNLSQTIVTAPIAGVISDRLIAPGALVSPQTAIVTLVPPQLEVVVNVEESQLGQIAPGQSVDLQVPAFANQLFTGVVKTISPTVDGRSRTAAVRIEPKDDSGMLRAGMFADLNIVTASRQNTLLVPRGAILSAGAGTSSMVVTIDNSGKAHRQPVTLGLLNDRLAEVVSGLDYGQLVATSGMNDLKEGDLVAPQIQQVTAQVATQ